MSKIEDYSFRRLAGNYVLLTELDEMARMYNTAFQCHEGDNALLTYGYIDHEAGLTFEILCFARYDAGRGIEFRTGNDQASFKIRYGGMKGNIEVLPYHFSMEQYQKKVEMIQAGYDYNEELRELRRWKAFDPDRHPVFVDDVAALLWKPDVRAERVWVRMEKMVDGKAAGILLNQPISKEFGVDAGDMVTLVSVPIEGRWCTLVELKN